MRWRPSAFPSLLVLFIALTALPAIAGVVGVFQGRIVQPKGVKAENGILYVGGRNGMARKVKVSKAVVVEYDEDVPKGQRRKEPAQALCEDALIRVTAEQSDSEDGEWKAINILILPEPEGKAGRPARVQKAAWQQTHSGAAERAKEPSTKEKASGTNGFCVP